jgi:hypothetical protein
VLAVLPDRCAFRGVRPVRPTVYNSLSSKPFAPTPRTTHTHDSARCPVPVLAPKPSSPLKPSHLHIPPSAIPSQTSSSSPTQMPPSDTAGWAGGTGRRPLQQQNARERTYGGGAISRERARARKRSRGGVSRRATCPRLQPHKSPLSCMQLHIAQSLHGTSACSSSTGTPSRWKPQSPRLRLYSCDLLFQRLYSCAPSRALPPRCSAVAFSKDETGRALLLPLVILLLDGCLDSLLVLFFLLRNLLGKVDLDAAVGGVVATVIVAVQRA